MSNKSTLRLLYGFIATLGIVLLAVVLTGCGSTVASSNSPAVSSPKENSVDWNGTWKSDPKLMVAEISNETITINIVSDGTEALYWKGTWPALPNTADGTVIVSDADTEALDASLMGSMEKTKPFTYNKGELSFKFSMLGVSKTIQLKK